MNSLCTASFTALLGVAIAAGFSQAADTQRSRARRNPKEVAVERAGIDRALSKGMPPSIKNLPLFGTIEWTVKEMPFVEKGPHAGISGMGMVVVNGRIYVMGAFIPAGDETKDPGRRTSRWAHQYDPETDRWTKLPDMPGRREYTRAIATEKDIYVVGGAVQKPYTPSADVFRLDLSQKPLQWQTMGQLTVPRTHMAVGKAGNYLVVAGGNSYDLAEKGYSLNTIQGVVDVLDLARPEQGWKQGKPIPGRPRGWAASAGLGGKLYVLGGLTFTASGKERRSPRERTLETLSYDPAEDRWTRLADPPIGISGWESAVYANRYIIVIGGVSDRWNDVPFVYDTKADGWMRINGPLPPGALFNDTGVCIIGDTIYVAGGEGPAGSHFNHFLIGRIEAALDR